LTVGLEGDSRKSRARPIAGFPCDSRAWGLRLVQENKPTSAKETKGRLASILRGAFAGPPTQLKDVPTRTGRRRAERVEGQGSKERLRSSRSANKKSESQRGTR